MRILHATTTPPNRILILCPDLAFERSSPPFEIADQVVHLALKLEVFALEHADSFSVIPLLLADRYWDGPAPGRRTARRSLAGFAVARNARTAASQLCS